MIGVSDEHRALAAAVAGWAGRNAAIPVARSVVDADQPCADLPERYWTGLCEQGWLGIAVGAERGGQGAEMAELVVVVEGLARELAPGPVAETALAAHLADRWGGSEGRDLVGVILAGRARVSIGLDPPRPGQVIANLAFATHLLAPLPAGGWSIAELGPGDVEPASAMDRTLGAGRLTATPSGATIELAHEPTDHGRDLAALVIGAEAVGAARWCLDTAAEHARTREQFGRPIGQFQAIKHRCADMAVALEMATAAVWDAARGADDADEAHLACAAVGALACDAFVAMAEDTIQILGGIGFTWEHDAHLYLRRAMTRRLQLGSAHGWYRETARAAAGTSRTQRLDLPAEADDHRSEVTGFLSELKQQPSESWNRAIADSGWLVPHWPAPYGRDADPVQQLVIDEEFHRAGIRRPHLQVGAWVLPTLIAHGTEAQQERWIAPTMRSEISWCQLFSEPGAGSDLAALSTRATRVEGGWTITGQKVWTSMATEADWGLLLARTSPDRPKHEGITCFCVDMASDGIDIRPLRELTGMTMFNEVFFDDLFVPDDCVVGEVDDGWRAGRTTLANERVSMGSGASIGPGVASLLAAMGPDPGDDELAEAGRLVAESLALSAMGTRATMRALAGAQPGPEASIRKLAGVEHDQRVQEVGLLMQGNAGMADEGDAAAWVNGFLWNRCLTIAGGTSEIQRNIIAERLLGLPRDP